MSYNPLKLDGIEIINIFNKDGEQTLATGGDQGIIVTGPSTINNSLTINPGNNRIKFWEGDNSIAQIGLRDSSTNEVFLQGWGSDFRIAVGGTYNNHALVIDNAKNTKLYGDLTINEDGNEFWVKSTDYNLARIIPRGSSGVNLDKGLFSLMASDGTNNNIEKVRIDSAGGSWFDGGAFRLGAGDFSIEKNTPVINVGVSNTTTGNARINLFSKNGTAANAFAIEFNKTDSTDRLEFIDGSGTANVKFYNGGTIEFVDHLKATGSNMKLHAGGNHIINIDLNGKFYPQTDNSVDLGFSDAGNRFRNLYMTGVADIPSIYLHDYIYHKGDTDTYIRFQTDHITLRANARDILNLGYHGGVSTNNTGTNVGQFAYAPDGLIADNLGGANMIRKGTDIAVQASASREEVTFIDGTKVQAHTSTGNGNNATCYQWYTSENVKVNPEKDYEYSVWIKSTGDDHLYLGWHEFDSAGNRVTSNPYFHTSKIKTHANSNNTSVVATNINGWTKLTFKLKSHRTTSGQADSAADRYATSNRTQAAGVSGNTGVMHSTTSLIHLRLGTCYGSVNGSKSYFYNPKIIEAQDDDYKFDLNVGEFSPTNMNLSGTLTVGGLTTFNGDFVSTGAYYSNGILRSRKNIISNSTYNVISLNSSRTTDDYGGLNKDYMKIDLVTSGPNTDGNSSAHGFGNFSLKLADNAGSTSMGEVLNITPGGYAKIQNRLQVGQAGGTGNSGRLDLFGRYSADKPRIFFKTDHPSATTQWDMAQIYAGDGGNFNGTLTFQVAYGSGNGSTPAALATALFIDDTRDATFYGNLGVGAVNTSFNFYNNGTTYLNGEAIVDSDLTISGAGNNGNARLMLSNGATQSGASQAVAGYGLLKQRDVNHQAVSGQQTHVGAYGWYTIAIPSGYSAQGLAADIELIVRTGGRHHNGKTLKKYIINTNNGTTQSVGGLGTVTILQTLDHRHGGGYGGNASECEFYYRTSVDWNGGEIIMRLYRADREPVTVVEINPIGSWALNSSTRIPKLTCHGFGTTYDSSTQKGQINQTRPTSNLSSPIQVEYSGWQKTSTNNKFKVSQKGPASGTASEVARFTNDGSLATSGYIYIGASSGTDWRLGKNINGTSSNNNFGIAKHSGTVLAMEIDAGNNNTTFTGTLECDGNIQVINHASTSSYAHVSINGNRTNGTDGSFGEVIFHNNGDSVATVAGFRDGADDKGSLVFQTQNGSAGFGTRMAINAVGDVAIGYGSPTSISANTTSLSISSTRNDLSGALISKANSTIKHQQYWDSSGYSFNLSSNSGIFKWNVGSSTRMALSTSGDLTAHGDVVAFGSPSDKRLKENIKPIESALDKAMKLQGVTFDWKKSDSILDIKEDIGFIAQDVKEVVPELVRENENGMLSMRHQGITPILLEAIKELKAEIEELKKQIK